MGPAGDRDGAQQAPASADLTPLPNSGISKQTNAPPIATEMDNMASDHDSLVTVRLSEPPSLHLNTAVPQSAFPTRKSPDYFPSNAVAETVVEEEDDSDSEIFEPDTSASKRGPNLQQELGQAGSGSSDEGQDDAYRRDSSSSAGSEKVNWEALQKKEDLESKTQHVRCQQIEYPFLVTDDAHHSLPLRCWPSWSRKMTGLRPTRRASRSRRSRSTGRARARFDLPQWHSLRRWSAGRPRQLSGTRLSRRPR